MKPLYYGQHSIIGNSGTLRDFSLRENHLAGYPSLLSQEHNIRLAVRLLADAHPNPTSSDFAKLNIMRNFSQKAKNLKSPKTMEVKR